MNPLFKPTPPISNVAKEEIYRLHRADTTKWTPRQLGTKFNISIKRVEAILRLKHLEKEMIAEGYIPQENLTKGMEQLMGVKAERSVMFVEPLLDVLPQVGAPKFEAVDEDNVFTAEDAAKVLKRRPLAELKAKMLDEEKKNPFTLKDSIKGVVQQTPVPTKAISRNTSEANPRFKFTFMDTSKNGKVRKTELLSHQPSRKVELRHEVKPRILIFNYFTLKTMIGNFDQREGRYFASRSAIVNTPGTFILQEEKRQPSNIPKQHNHFIIKIWFIDNPRLAWTALLVNVMAIF